LSNNKKNSYGFATGISLVNRTYFFYNTIIYNYPRRSFGWRHSILKFILVISRRATTKSVIVFITRPIALYIGLGIVTRPRLHFSPRSKSTRFLLPRHTSAKPRLYSTYTKSTKIRLCSTYTKSTRTKLYSSTYTKFRLFNSKHTSTTYTRSARFCLFSPKYISIKPKLYFFPKSARFTSFIYANSAKTIRHSITYSTVSFIKLTKKYNIN